jgi:hypothetical protein
MKSATPGSIDWPAYYQIKISGQLDPHWSTWFDGLSLTEEPDGNTVLAGLVADQAALYGLLARARDLGLTLIAVIRDQPGQAA